jgi:hypothetical protein
VLAVFAFHTQPPRSLSAFAAVALSAVLLTAGVTVLSHSQSAPGRADEPAAT